MRAAFLLTAVALVGCGSQPHFVDLPSNHGHAVDDALRRLHAVGLRASFPAARIPCGDGLPSIDVQSPRSPARVKRGSVVTLRFLPSFIPSAAVPKHHARWTYVPRLVGEDFGDASKKLHAIWPCVQVQAAAATSDARVIVVAQSPRAGTRVTAFGVLSGRGYRPTTVNVTVAVRS
jgi:beta-lactam-binding protein with PASTA domain